MRDCLASLLSTTIAMLMSLEAHAHAYSLTQVGTSAYHGADVNNSGQVVGTLSGTNFSLPGAFSWVNGTTTILPPTSLPPGYPSGSASYPAASAVNDAGQIVGITAFLKLGSGSTIRGTIWNSGSASTLEPVGGSALGPYTQSRANAINDFGQVAGQNQIPPPTLGTECCSVVAATWVGNAGTNVGVLSGHTDSFATAINNSGQMVGVSEGPGSRRAALWSNGDIVDLGDGRASAINDTGQIVGRNHNAAVYWNAGSLTALELDWGAGSEANDINNAGVAVGRASNGAGWVVGSPWNAMFWDGLKNTDLNTVMDISTWHDWTLTDAIAINDVGQILARAEDFRGRNATILLTPCIDCDVVDSLTYLNRYREVTGIPEPETYALMLTGLAVVAASRRWRASKCATRPPI